MDLRAAIRLHLAELTPRARAKLVADSEGLDGLVTDPRGEPQALAAWRAVGDADVDRELATCARLGVRVVGREESGWPPLLDEIPDPPHALWMRGSLPSDGLAVAVVGPRRPSAYGVTMARRLARDLADAGCVIISGGARGVDALAHEAALDAGTPTVAVLGCGLDVAYPPGNRKLFARIAEAGAVVSELPCGTPPLPHHFPVRNRILAGWSCAVAVIEAGARSGTLITAHLGIALGRDVLAVPGAVTSPTSAGTNELLARGACVLRTIDDFRNSLRGDQLALLRAGPAPAREAAAARASDCAVLAALPAGQALTVDELVDATGLSVGPVLARLASHETFGLVESLAGGLWMRVERRIRA